MSTISEQKRELVTKTLKCLCKEGATESLTDIQEGSFTAQSVANRIRSKMEDHLRTNTIIMDSRAVGGLLSLMYREKAIPELERFVNHTLSEKGNRLTLYSYRIPVE